MLIIRPKKQDAVSLSHPSPAYPHLIHSKEKLYRHIPSVCATGGTYTRLVNSERNERGQTMDTYARLTIYTDGASRGNPGLAATGIHIVDETTSRTVIDFGVALGITTNNVAEYQAVLQAVEWVLAHKELLADNIHLSFRLDSSLVVSQLSGTYEIHAPHLRPLAESVKAHLDHLPGTHTFEHIPRKENKHADKLANDTLDKGV